MLYYSVESYQPRDSRDIFESVRHAMFQAYDGVILDETLAFLMDGYRYFWGRSLFGRFCARVYYQPMSKRDFYDLQDEMRGFQERVRKFALFVFSPGFTKDFEEMILAMPPEAKAKWMPGDLRFVQYFILKPYRKGQEAMAIKEFHRYTDVNTAENGGFETRMALEANQSKERCASDARSYNFFREARLSREELLEFMELGLRLRKIRGV